jgi:multiple sugar transport system substrate-binding protein
MQVRAILLTATLVLVPSGLWAADLVVWWERGFNPEEDEAIKESITAFEQETGKQVEANFYSDEELRDNMVAAIAARQPPDFAFGFWLQDYIGQWAFDDRLADLTDTVGYFSDQFDPDVLEWVEWPNARTGQEALYALPIGLTVNHVHVWKSLLERAGFTLADIPRQWDAFWTFWCDRVQPAVRQATGRNDIYGVGLPMSIKGDDTWTQFHQFIAAYEANYVSRNGQLVIDDPQVRRKLIEAATSYTAIYRKSCTPAGSVAWANIDNNKQFHAQAVIMTPNQSLSIPNAFKRERPNDYYENVATIEWPLGPRGQLFPIVTDIVSAVVPKDGSNTATAKEFVRFLVAEGWLAHYLDFSADRLLPPMPKLLKQPYWLDPSDPHRMAAAMQLDSRPLAQEDAIASGNWRYVRIDQEHVWAKVIQRIITEDVTPEQAVDEAIARIHQILSE